MRESKYRRYRKDPVMRQAYKMPYMSKSKVKHCKTTTGVEKDNFIKSAGKGRKTLLR